VDVDFELDSRRSCVEENQCEEMELMVLLDGLGVARCDGAMGVLSLRLLRRCSHRRGRKKEGKWRQQVGEG
jgi:hypothetical protein